MKTLSLYAVILFSIFVHTQSFAQKSVIKETINVWGNCGMCKKTIEKSAKTAGATTANWNAEIKQLKVSYAVTKTTGAKIQEVIANAGYDTQDLTADNKAYHNLNPCCQYERKNDAAAVNTPGKACCSDAQHCKDMDACKEMVNCKDKDCCKK